MIRTKRTASSTRPVGMNIIDAFRERRLFGGLPEFHDLRTWSRWLVFLKAVFGLPLDDGELGIFRRHTGRSEPRREGYPESVAVVGVQSGKSFIAAMIVAFAAAMSDLRDVWAILVSQDARAALRTLFRYVSRPFEEVPALKRLVINTTADTIQLRRGVTIAAYPCRPAAVRGLRAIIAVCDELAFFTATDGRPTDVEMLRALRGRLATTAGKLVVLSSPYAQTGALYELHRKHHGRDDSTTLVWQASAPDMNPTLAADYLARVREDPEAYVSEVEGQFRAGASTLLDTDALSACVVEGRRELLPVEGVEYSAFVDPSGGSKDAFTLAVAHRDGERIFVDCVRAWVPPFNPSGVVEEASALLKSYGCHRVTGDRYAGEWPREAFRAHGIEYDVAELDRSRLYLELLPVVNAGGIELLDDAKLLRELRGLERRRGTAGRDRVDHRPGFHDDRANALAGVASLLGNVAEVPMPPPIIVGGVSGDTPWLAMPYEAPAGYFPERWRR